VSLSSVSQSPRTQTADPSRFCSTRFAEGRPWVDATDYGIEKPTISR